MIGLDSKEILIKKYYDGEFTTGLIDSTIPNGSGAVILLEENGFVFGYYGVSEQNFFKQKLHERPNGTKRFTIGITSYKFENFTTQVNLNITPYEEKDRRYFRNSADGIKDYRK